MRIDPNQDFVPPCNRCGANTVLRKRHWLDGEYVCMERTGCIEWQELKGMADEHKGKLSALSYYAAFGAAEREFGITRTNYYDPLKDLAKEAWDTAWRIAEAMPMSLFESKLESQRLLCAWDGRTEEPDLGVLAWEVTFGVATALGAAGNAAYMAQRSLATLVIVRDLAWAAGRRAAKLILDHDGQFRDIYTRKRDATLDSIEIEPIGTWLTDILETRLLAERAAKAILGEAGDARLIATGVTSEFVSSANIDTWREWLDWEIEFEWEDSNGTINDTVGQVQHVLEHLAFLTTKAVIRGERAGGAHVRRTLGNGRINSLELRGFLHSVSRGVVMAIIRNRFAAEYIASKMVKEWTSAFETIDADRISDSDHVVDVEMLGLLVTEVTQRISLVGESWDHPPFFPS